MYIILLSGGSGKRLWPLSNETRPKQFLKLLKNNNGEYESMVQRVYGQIKQADIGANIVIATCKSQSDGIKNHLGKTVEIVIEPEQRNTFPAVALASTYIYSEKHVNTDEIIVVLPVDPYVDMEYFTALKMMENAIRKNIANISLMGIKPTYSSQKYGYIVPKVPDSHLVELFKEKPSEKEASKLIGNGALWNGGVFAFRLGYILNIIRKYISFETYKDIDKMYSKLPKTSFDCEVVEKEKSVAVVEHKGLWKDIGTWDTFSEIVDSVAIGNVIYAESCSNTNVINELDIPITVVGIKDIVVIAGSDGILVSDKVQSQFLKNYVDNLESHL